MSVDFTLVLVLLVFGSGFIVLLDWFLFQRINSEVFRKIGVAGAIEVLVDYSRSFFPVLSIVLVLRSFLFEPFQIPSGSMKPTLLIGDFIVVNKFEYGLRLPVLGHLLFQNKLPVSGDVMVFKFPEKPSINFIKRVIGVPGDIISYRNKNLLINGKIQSKMMALNPVRELPPPLTREDVETFEKTGKHRIWTRVTSVSDNCDWPITRELSGDCDDIVVPPGKYFVMGDNRDNSNDSRFWGFVDESLIVGRAFAVWMHWDEFFSLPSFNSVRLIE